MSWLFEFHYPLQVAFVGCFEVVGQDGKLFDFVVEDDLSPSWFSLMVIFFLKYLINLVEEVGIAFCFSTRNMLEGDGIRYLLLLRSCDFIRKNISKLLFEMFNFFSTHHIIYMTFGTKSSQNSHNY